MKRFVPRKKLFIYPESPGISIRYYIIFIFITTLNIKVHGQQRSVSGDQAAGNFKPSGKIWGYVFGDYFYKLHADSLNRGNVQFSGIPKNFNAFTFRRIYLGYDYQISEKFSAHVLLSNENDNADAIGERTFYIKAANIQWKNIIPNNDLIIGQSTTPLFVGNSESVWGYRSVERTLVDMRNFGGGTDLGIAWHGRLGSNNNYGYNLMLANGTSARPENNKYKKFYYEAYARLLNKKIYLDVTGTAETAGGGKNMSVIKGTAAYTGKPLSAGIEFIHVKRTKAALDLTDQFNPSDVSFTPFGISLFLHGLIIPGKLNYFARYDNFNPDAGFDPNIIYSSSPANYKENFITAGIDWMPVKSFHIEPNIWYDSFQAMEGVNTGNDYDMVARITFYYVFKPQ